jgi:hypothetical protein
LFSFILNLPHYIYIRAVRDILIYIDIFLEIIICPLLYWTEPTLALIYFDLQNFLPNILAIIPSIYLFIQIWVFNLQETIDIYGRWNTEIWLVAGLPVRLISWLLADLNFHTMWVFHLFSFHLMTSFALVTRTMEWLEFFFSF